MVRRARATAPGLPTSTTATHRQGREFVIGHAQAVSHGEHVDERFADDIAVPVDLRQGFEGLPRNGEDADDLCRLQVATIQGRHHYIQVVFSALPPKCSSSNGIPALRSARKVRSKRFGSRVGSLISPPGTQITNPRRARVSKTRYLLRV